MGKEIELKYAATPRQLQRLQAHFDGFTPVTMQTTYYDTPDGQLSRRHITLRCRLENGVGICTVKTPISGHGRGEWETPGTDITSAVPELCKLGCSVPLRELTAPGLIPVCGARFTRLLRTLTVGETRVELALDQGVLLGGGREVPLCEVELELKSGSEGDLQSFGCALSRLFSLTPEPKSKFRRALDLTMTP